MSRSPRISKAFVVTVSLLSVTSCKERTAPDPIGPDDKSASADAGKASKKPEPSATTAEPTKVTRKRKRTAPAPAVKYATTARVWADYAGANPTDASGRTVFVGSDDNCYVEVPMKEEPKMLPPGMRPVDYLPVDCPATLDDPAWDSCSYGQLQVSTKHPECYCDLMGGNPPPPPMIVPCPKK